MMIAQIERAPNPLIESSDNGQVESKLARMLRRSLYTVTAVSGVLFVADAALIVVQLVKNHGF